MVGPGRWTAFQKLNFGNQGVLDCIKEVFFYAFWNFVASKVQFLEDRSSFVMANVNKQKKINLSLKWSNWGFGAESAFCHFLIKRYCTAIHFTPSVNINVT